MEDCPKRHACPHLGYQACAEARAEMERLKTENRDLRRVFSAGGGSASGMRSGDRRLSGERGGNSTIKRGSRSFTAQIMRPITATLYQKYGYGRNRRQSGTSSGRAGRPERAEKARGAKGTSRRNPEKSRPRAGPDCPGQSHPMSGMPFRQCQRLPGDGRTYPGRPRHYPASSHPLRVHLRRIRLRRKKTRILP